MKRKQIIQQLKFNHNLTNKDINIFAEINSVDNDEHLFIYIYDKSKRDHVVAINKKTEEYITIRKNSDDYSFLTGTIYNYISQYNSYYAKKREINIEQNSEKIIKEYLEIKSVGINEIDNFQRKILKKKLKAKHKKITDEIDKEMSKVRKVPKYINDYVMNKLFSNRYLIYSHTTKKINTCICSNCNSRVNILSKDIKHKKEYKCPKCKVRAQFISYKKLKLIEEHNRMSFFQKTTDNNIVFRSISYKKKIDTTNNHTELCSHEYHRMIFKGKEIKKYYYGEFKQTGNRRWCNAEENTNYVRYSINLYEGNLKSVFNSDLYKYTKIYKYLKNINGVFEPNIVTEHIDNKVFEFFNDNSLYILINKFYNIEKYLDVTNDNMLKKLKINKHDLKVLKSIKESNKLEEAFIILQRYRQLLIDIDSKDLNSLIDKLGYNNYDYIRLIRNEIVNKNTILRINKMINKIKSEDITDYVDYLNMLIRLEIDINKKENIVIKNIKKEHDKLVDLINLKKYEKYEEQIRNVYEKLNFKEYENNKYKIIAPKNVHEILNEGKQLKHCVANYIEKIADERTIILFLRKKEALENPFYTIELLGNVIAQCRGFRNKKTTKDIDDFLEDFVKSCKIKKAA